MALALMLVPCLQLQFFGRGSVGEGSMIPCRKMPESLFGVHHSHLVAWENQPKKLTGSKFVGDVPGFSNFFGVVSSDCGKPRYCSVFATGNCLFRHPKNSESCPTTRHVPRSKLLLLSYVLGDSHQPK